ncbi:short chain dehydrogenase/reductase family [Paecilomyces variotii No. 5]|uniref:Short chain dehydrogenase/reductase family n=1 Tax=Byssochlamys spectabilis (strain No. 5 / NBRC 109023) TaxID=1356009 RepID=V5FEY9_BYSSN|nr:short chain dehydrogenase/reductase family [Paecilomyces variotii No. 5]
MAEFEASKLFSVKGLVAIITGGGSGLGAVMARALDANGADKVFILGRREQNLKEVAAQAINKSIIPVTADVTSKESLQAAYDAISKETDHVDLLVANSGIMGPSISPGAPGKPAGSTPTLSELRDHLWATPMEDFSNVFNVNISGTFYTVLAFIPLLQAADQKRPPPVPGKLSPPKPQVVITSSIGGFSRIAAFSPAYSISKSATNYMIKSLSTMLVKYGIRVNGIAPGLYYSEMAAPAFEAHNAVGAGISDGSLPPEFIPITRGGSSEDIASIILWMAGAGGGYLSGNIVVSDGGRLSTVPSTY